MRKKRKKEKKLNREELIGFCSQMAAILHSGISSFEGISLMMEEQENPAGRAALEGIYQEMMAGGSLGDGIEKSGLFPEYACRMIRLGETSGRTDEVMNHLADYYQQEEELSNAVWHAVSYPLFMLIMMLGVLFVLIAKVMPIFQSVYESLGTGMRGTAGAILGIGTVLNRYSAVIVAVFAVLFAGIWWTARTERGRAALNNFVRKSSAVKKTAASAAEYRLSFGLYICLCSGVNPESGLQIMEKLMEYPEAEKKISVCREKMLSGMLFEDALAETGIFGKKHTRMLKIGQRTGTTEQALRQIAQQCREETLNRLWDKISLIEPTVVIVLAVLVGIILLSVMLPLMSIMSEIG